MFIVVFDCYLMVNKVEYIKLNYDNDNNGYDYRI